MEDKNNLFLKNDSDSAGSITQLDIDEQGEKSAALEIFKMSLVNFFLASDDETLDIIDDYNHVLIILMDKDKKFSKDLANCVLNNQEVLTANNIIIEGKSQPATIYNWLRDFIKLFGTNNFDNLTLTRYLTASANTKILSDNERKIVKKLLILYRNLKFFHKSLEETSLNEWEVIPTNKKAFSNKIRIVSGAPKTTEEKRIEELKEAESSYGRNDLEKMAIEEEIGEEKEIANLKIEAAKFTHGSLERKAIEEEIKRLSNK